MKKNIWLSLLLFINLIPGNGQITHEKTIEGDYAYFVQLKEGVSKYCTFHNSLHQIKVYNLDGSLYRTLSNVPDTMSLYYISEGLFNLDSKIEYLASDWDYGIWVLNEDGDILFKADTLNLLEDLEDSWFELESIQNTEDGAKMVLMNWDTNKLEIFSLPGKSPYSKGNQSSTLALVNDTLSISGGNSVYLGGYTNTDNQKLSLSNDTLYLSNGGWVYIGPGASSMAVGEIIIDNLPQTSMYPNPANDNAYLNYQLPENETEGLLDFYDSKGQLVNSIQLSGSKGVEKINLSYLTSGSYFYQIKTSKGVSKLSKLVVY